MKPDRKVAPKKPPYGERLSKVQRQLDLVDMGRPLNGRSIRSVKARYDIASY